MLLSASWFHLEPRWVWTRAHATSVHSGGPTLVVKKAMCTKGLWNWFGNSHNKLEIDVELSENDLETNWKRHFGILGMDPEAKWLNSEWVVWGGKPMAFLVWFISEPCKDGAAATTRKWHVLGVPVCKEAWQLLMKCSNHRYNRLYDAFKRGMSGPKVDMRTLKPVGTISQEWMEADGFFNFMCCLVCLWVGNFPMAWAGTWAAYVSHMGWPMGTPTWG